MTFGEVDPPWWSDKPVAIVGGGPSLHGFDFGQLRGKFHVLAVKGVMFDLPWADAGFGLDLPDFRDWAERLGSLPFPVFWAFPGQTPTSGLRGRLPENVTALRRSRAEGLSDDPGMIHAGGTSGYGALNLAFLKQAKQIVLLGFDYKPGPKGEWRHNSEHYKSHGSQSPDALASWVKPFDAAAVQLKARGVTVLNANPGSLVTAFPRVTFAECRARLEWRMAG